MDFERSRSDSERFRRNPIGIAFGISLLIHAGLFGVWQVGDLNGWWTHEAAWLRLGPEPEPLEQSKAEKKVIPLKFVEVDPSTAVDQAPKETIFYGVHNTVNANPDPKESAESKPEIDGSQDKVLRLADNPTPKKFPLQPAQPEPEPEPEPETETKPEPETRIAKIDPDSLSRGADAMKFRPPPEPKKRPRTLKEARAQQEQSPMTLAGRKTKQEGGVKRRGRVSLNVKATPFGAYDLAFIRAVEQRWYDLLDSTSFVQRSGKVVLDFKLKADGSITDLKVQENDVGEILSLLCQRAIQDPAPFAPWPSDMRRLVGGNFREITFTFYYN